MMILSWCSRFCVIKSNAPLVPLPKKPKVTSQTVACLVQLKPRWQKERAFELAPLLKLLLFIIKYVIKYEILEFSFSLRDCLVTTANCRQWGWCCQHGDTIKLCCSENGLLNSKKVLPFTPVSHMVEYRGVVTLPLGEGVQMHTGEPESSKKAIWMLMKTVSMFETECRERTQEHELRIKMMQNNVEFLCDTAGKQQYSVLTC